MRPIPIYLPAPPEPLDLGTTQGQLAVKNDLVPKIQAEVARFEALKKDGVGKLFYIPGDGMLGDDAEGATDGSHPNDLGFVRQAAVFEPVLREALGR